METTMRVLFAYDGSACADAAIHDLTRAGLPRASELVVLSASEAWLPPPSIYAAFEGPLPDREAADVHAASILARTAAERLRALLPGWRVEPRGVYGDPAQCILDEAERMRADLIVVGSHGRSALGRLLLGSVSQKVATMAPCSVRVARDGAGPRTGPVRLVVAVDGSTGGESAVREVARRSWPARSSATLVAAFGTTFATADVERKADVYHRVHARAEQTLAGSGLVVMSTIVDGDPRHTIVEVARERDADCVFLGTRDLSRAGRFLLGSVSTSVVSHAHCSVEVVRDREVVIL